MLRARCGLPRDNGPEHQSNNGMNFLAAYPFLDTSLVAFWAPFSKMVGMMFSEELYRSLHYLDPEYPQSSILVMITGCLRNWPT